MMEMFLVGMTEVLATLLAIVAPISGGDASVAIEVEALPLLEEIVPYNPDAKPDLQRQLEAVAKSFWSSLTAKHLAEFKAKFCIPNQV